MVEFSAELTLIGSLIFITGSRPRATVRSRPWYTTSRRIVTEENQYDKMQKIREIEYR